MRYTFVTWYCYGPRKFFRTIQFNHFRSFPQFEIVLENFSPKNKLSKVSLDFGIDNKSCSVKDLALLLGNLKPFLFIFSINFWKLSDAVILEKTKSSKLSKISSSIILENLFALT